MSTGLMQSGADSFGAWELPADVLQQLQAKARRAWLRCVESPTRYSGAGFNLLSLALVAEEAAKRRMGAYMPACGALGWDPPNVIFVSTEEQIPAVRPEPVRSELDEHWYQALSQGRLIFHRTAANSWLPSYEEAPVSLSADWEWADAYGLGTLVSWVSYHLAYHPYWEDKLPCQIGLIGLAEGSWLLAPIELEQTKPKAGLRLRADIRFDGGRWVPFFVPEEESA